MIDTLPGGKDRRRTRSTVSAHAHDEDLISTCHQFVARLREFHSPVCAYALAEAAGVCGPALDEAEAVHAAAYEEIEALQRRLTSLPARSMAGVSAKMEAIGLLCEYQGMLSPMVADDVHQSCVRDLRVNDTSKLTGSPSSLDWMGRRYTDRHSPVEDQS